MGEILYEFAQLGQQMRVSAIDTETNVEVVILAPVTATRLQMQNVAGAKLRRTLEKRSQNQTAATKSSGRYA
ncbi:hypothetical protein GCM10007989_35690 [Devosia pacifica]|uniref:DUF6898 domain-containing protein n=1 Tax=Devosia pacifica TaxID=1335967 RepID=A0A918SDT9_9HYPH|nr:serine hydroxymethyltransferase [Devosia pacifica]GHA36423.1 hypothetical protein GCM10007989_35690 [Devosia pacifica]